MIGTTGVKTDKRSSEAVGPAHRGLNGSQGQRTPGSVPVSGKTSTKIPLGRLTLTQRRKRRN